LVPNNPVDADPTRFGKGFQPRRDIHTVAEYVVWLDDHIPEIDPNPELDPALWCSFGVSLRHSLLDLDGAPNSVDHPLELGQEAITSVLYDPAPVLPDLGIDQFLEMSFKPFVCPLLIRAHQARISGHIGGEDGGEAAD